MNLSLGKWRALTALSTPKGIFTIVALDHTTWFRQLFAPTAPNDAPYEPIVNLKLDLVRSLAPHASAILLDPIYGLGPAIQTAALPGRVGLLSLLEDARFAAPGPDHVTHLLEGWSVAKAKRLGADGVKLHCYYRYDDPVRAPREEALLRQIIRDCETFDLPFFPEPLVYDVEPGARRRVIIENARRIAALGADVLKLEFPVDVRVEADERVWRAACRELSQAIEKPWTLLSAGVDYETFKRQVRVACEEGASGFVAGRAIWQEAGALTGEARRAFLETVATARLSELAEIAEACGTGWPQIYGRANGHLQTALQPDWFRSY